VRCWDKLPNFLTGEEEEEEEEDDDDDEDDDNDDDDDDDLESVSSPLCVWN